MRNGNETAEATFPLLAQQGGLIEHWYPVGFSDDLQRNQAIRQVVLGVPILVWRKEDANVCGFVDICPHRQAQLSQGSIDQFGLTCPYHGWRFGSEGQCNHIPGAPANTTPHETISLRSVPVCEHGRMIWAWMGQNSPSSPPRDLESFPRDADWCFTRARRIFPYALDDVIENFMDFAHTPVVHPGLIRGISAAKERGVTIETSELSVRAVHDPVDEKVGFLSSLIVPRGKLVQHADTFTIPGKVKVEYWFGDDAPKFFAFLGMTPITEKETLILLTLGTRFGWLNPLIALALPRLIRKVLDQDDRILAQQRANLDLIANRSARSLSTDAVDVTVRALRSHIRDSSRTRPKPGTRRIQVRL